MPESADRRQEAARQLQAPDSFATTLVLLFVDEFGFEALAWHPETVLLELHAAFGVELPRANLDRLCAGITLVTTDRFYKDLPSFVTLANILSGDSVNPGVWDPADTLECAWGITEALLLGPPEDGDDEPFTDDIRGYIAAVLAEEGILTPPDVLQLALHDERTALFRHRAQLLGAADARLGAAIHEIQEAKTTEITTILKDSLQRLLAQLTRLHLATGDVAGLLERLSQRSAPAGA